MKIYRGVLGYSNLRFGVEFYAIDGARRHDRARSEKEGRDPKFGHLLVDEMGEAGAEFEGRHVVVFVADERAADITVSDIAAALEESES